MKKAKGPHGKSEKYATKQICSLREEAIRTFDSNVDPNRASLIRDIGNKWVNGTKLHYHFLKSTGLKGTKNQRDIVEQAFQKWRQLGIGINFENVDEPSEAEIRIGFLRDDGAWSYIGRYILNIGAQERTMNFGWVLRGGEGLDTALHEIGHTLGFPHEHQNPNAGIIWDEEAVYAALARPPNEWSRDKTFHNIIRKLAPTSVEGSDWDPQSIMHYEFGAALIKAPEPWATRGVPDPDGLSVIDVERVKRFYPPIDDNRIDELRPFQSQRLHLDPGEQANFAVTPGATRRYTFATFGESDVVMALFEDRNGNPRFITADDDSGQNLNARFRVRLRRNRRYILRVRLYHSRDLGDTAVMMW